MKKTRLSKSEIEAFKEFKKETKKNDIENRKLTKDERFKKLGYILKIPKR